MRRIISLMIIVQMLIFAACTSDDIIDFVSHNADNDTIEHVVPLILNVTCQPFDDEPQTRGEYMNEWADGTELYVRFKSGSNWISGTATYVKSVNMWAIRYNGAIPQGTKQRCEVAYFVNPKAISSESVSMTSSTAMYLDGSATYDYQNGSVTINATLMPQTARIRFKGTPGQEVTVCGLEFLRSYNLKDGSITRESELFLDSLTFEVDNTGYTKFLYVNIKSDRKLSVWENHQTCYTRVMNAPVMSEGSSGNLTIPTQSQHSGWTKTVQSSYENNVLRYYWYEYRMIPVEGGMFQMGNEKNGPIHGVILDSYLIGETEVPQGLWYAVRRDNAGKHENVNWPACGIYWDECRVFCQRLNSAVGMSFRMPTEAEWEYAARGGKQSKGYTYSGSNNIKDIAIESRTWGVPYPIRQCKPNELGIYDMSGNVSEYCSDYFDKNYYSVSPIVNPKGPENGSERVRRGGNYYEYYQSYSMSSVFDRFPVYTSSSDLYYYASVGLRLAL